MDNLCYLKEEYVDINVKEEDIAIKIEYTQPSSPYYVPIQSYQQSLMIPWFQNPLKASYESYYSQLNSVGYQYYPKKAVSKPFKIIRDEKPRITYDESTVSTPSIKVEEQDNDDNYVVVNPKPKKQSHRVSACKNYIGLVCAGFARAILNAGTNSALMNHMENFINQKRNSYNFLHDKKTEKLIETFKTYIYKSMCGKKIKKYNGDRDFKVRNTHELDNLLTIKGRDVESTRFRKELLREMFDYFFSSEQYVEWINTGMMSEINRSFFLRNKKEIHKKFLDPIHEKPRFNHEEPEESDL